MSAKHDSSGLLTQSRVDVNGNFTERGQQMMMVDGILFRLKFIEFSLIFVLACHARNQAGLESPVRVFGGLFLSINGILAVLRSMRVDLGERSTTWTQQDIMSAKWGIRRALKRKGLDVNLVESLADCGYRLSTPGRNVRIVLTSIEEEQAIWE